MSTAFDTQLNHKFDGPIAGVEEGMDTVEGRRVLLSIVTPAFNEAKNLPVLHDRLRQACAAANVDWEWIVVDDHSSDGTFAAIRRLADEDSRIQGLRLARNSGAHTAILCGMQHAAGDCAVIMAADLQDPPETIGALLAEWQAGNHVVWAVRGHREGETAKTVGFSRLYYFLMRRIVGMREMPASGADFFMLDRRVVEALCEFDENNVSLMALITWMGFRQSYIEYDKQARLHGQSGWNLGKKLKLVVDSVTSFSYLPIRLMSIFGFVFAVAGFLYAALVIANAFAGNPAQGWSSLMVVVLVVGGLQMLMMGILGEYVWRALDEARRRPRFILEEKLGQQSLPQYFVSTGVEGGQGMRQKGSQAA